MTEPVNLLAEYFPKTTATSGLGERARREAEFVEMLKKLGRSK